MDLSSPSSQLNFEMWGTSSCSALATDNNAIWIATNHSEQGRVYIAGAENPLQDELRGDFNLPSPLSSGCISCLSFGVTEESAENLLVGYEDGGVTRIFGRENTISLNNLEEGSIQHNFSSLSCEQFTYHFLNTDITVNPNDLGPDYGNTEVTVHLQDPVFPAPVFPHPEFTLDFWYQIKTEESFTAFPCEVRVEFSSPTPNGDENLQLWNYSESENEWIPDSADEEVTVTNWNFTSSPYFVDYTTEHFSSWAMNDGSGGALAFPPQSPDNIRIVRNESTVTITWDEVTEDTWGNSIENVSYDIYSSENPYSDWELEISGLTETSWNYQHASESKKFFRIVAVYVP
ncbi:MAG: hypothetical protein DRZ79_05205 [Candidatus Cloacimonadota bacterium]|nr:MAG: hypothetical protein DRZ79_05205 [Candidatus Cloacimonadota bacterium]